jgi:hypothetical protein
MVMQPKAPIKESNPILHPVENSVHMPSDPIGETTDGTAQNEFSLIPSFLRKK